MATRPTRTQPTVTTPAEPTPDGILVVDKPAGWTSHDVVARARRLCATRKVGHAGTLDPMATGVLVLGVGRATRLLTFLVGCDKDYTATIRLGQVTVTDDAEGEVTASAGAHGIEPDAVLVAAATLTGDIEQVPSAVSAIKVKGERAYHRVRAGEAVDLPARPVTVGRFEVVDQRRLEVDGTPVLDVDIEVTVSSGTYVRALARDLGAALGTGGHLTALRRTRVGGFALTEAHPLADLEARQGERMPVTPLAQAARAAFVVREVDDAEARTIGYGQRLPSAVPGRSDPVAAIAPDGRLVAMLDESRPTARSLVVFSPTSS
jgi:tRNA pseudouridine55 synthase